MTRAGAFHADHVHRFRSVPSEAACAVSTSAMASDFSDGVAIAARGNEADHARRQAQIGFIAAGVGTFGVDSPA